MHRKNSLHHLEGDPMQIPAEIVLLIAYGVAKEESCGGGSGGEWH